jgi:hypothetical protein
MITINPGRYEAFVRTLKRDYVRVSARPNARAVFEQLPGWGEHNNHGGSEPRSRLQIAPRVHQPLNPRGPVDLSEGSHMSVATRRTALYVLALNFARPSIYCKAHQIAPASFL